MSTPSAALARLLAKTPARLAIGRSGPRLTTASYLRFLADHGRARDAVFTEVPPAVVKKLGLVELGTAAGSRAAYLRDPGLGRTLAPSARARLARCRKRPEVQILVIDGLSSAAVVAHAGALLRALVRELAGRRRRLGTPIFVRNGRVRIQDEIGHVLRPEVCCAIVGERPGLATATSLSAYVIHRPTRASTEPDRTLISNIHDGGLAPAAAARRIADLVDTCLAHEASGAALAAALAATGAGDAPGAHAGSGAPTRLRENASGRVRRGDRAAASGARPRPRAT
ncbi:MAG: ethanolamine ammonia-lyase subunit EutC [Deltaproteobacteria bacterium]|nr:ethanolamine ammonia-lyase subunit EutC [Deltaproteobacteria bacterium]